MLRAAQLEHAFQSTPDLINRENVKAAIKCMFDGFQSTPDLINRENFNYLVDIGTINVSIHSRFN